VSPLFFVGVGWAGRVSKASRFGAAFYLHTKAGWESGVIEEVSWAKYLGAPGLNWTLLRVD
jgi:hypothetical protein